MIYYKNFIRLIRDSPNKSFTYQENIFWFSYIPNMIDRSNNIKLVKKYFYLYQYVHYFIWYAK